MILDILYWVIWYLSLGSFTGDRSYSLCCWLRWAKGIMNDSLGMMMVEVTPRLLLEIILSAITLLVFYNTHTRTEPAWLEPLCSTFRLWSAIQASPCQSRPHWPTAMPCSAPPCNRMSPIESHELGCEYQPSTGVRLRHYNIRIMTKTTRWWIHTCTQEMKALFSGWSWGFIQLAHSYHGILVLGYGMGDKRRTKRPSFIM